MANKQLNPKSKPKARKKVKKKTQAEAKVEKGEVVRGKGKRKRSRKKSRYTAATADKYELYQLAVQSPEEDVRFLARVYRSHNKRPPLHFREDFCGTALLSGTWVKRGEKYTAEGFDICTETLAWGRRNNLDPLGEAGTRVKLHPADVRAPSTRKPDVRAAQNFSYFVFHTRAEMLDYCRSAYDDLADGTMYGSRQITSDTDNREIRIPLDKAGLAALNAARGSRITCALYALIPSPMPETKPVARVCICTAT